MSSFVSPTTIFSQSVHSATSCVLVARLWHEGINDLAFKNDVPFATCNLDYPEGTMLRLTKGWCLKLFSQQKILQATCNLDMFEGTKLRHTECWRLTSLSVQTIFRVTRNLDLPEGTKLEFLKIIGTYHMRVLDGLDSLVQLSGLLAQLSQLKNASAPVA